jgi:hypothetical protein
MHEKEVTPTLDDEIRRLAAEAGHTTPGETIASLKEVIVTNSAYLYYRRTKHFTTYDQEVAAQNRTMAAAIVWIETLTGE